MAISLGMLQRALKGLVVLSSDLEAMADNMFMQKTPDNWVAVAYPSLKPLTPWFEDFAARADFFIKWVETGTPVSSRRRVVGGRVGDNDRHS